jgi:hypothetical protein
VSPRALPERIELACTCEEPSPHARTFARVHHWPECPLHWNRFVPALEQRHAVYDSCAELNQAVCACDWQHVRELAARILATLNR